MRKRKHTHEYVKRIIADESNYTEEDIVILYCEKWGMTRTYDNVIEELTFQSVDSIRWFMDVGKYAK